jgi:hypothetical protein
MQLPEFLFCENKSALPGAGLILYTQPPYWVGQVMKFDSHNAWELWLKANDGQVKAMGKPHGYSIAIVMIGALGAYRLPDSQAGADELAAVFRRMSDFYLEEKIKPNAGYYRRYQQ